MPGPASNGIPLKTIGTDGDDMIDFRNDTIPTYHTAYGDAELFDGDFKPGVIFTGGNDIIYGAGMNDVLVGDVGAAQYGTVIGGNDTIYGGDGFDAIWGDIMSAGPLGITVIGGNDKLFGGLGIDRLTGGGGDDLLDGGDGSDTTSYWQPRVTGSDSARVIIDLAYGESWSEFYGNDTLVSIENVAGSTGNDWIAGDAAANTIEGGLGDDVLLGRAGNDFIIDSDVSADAMYGDDGDDTIVSGTGNDWIEGGAGNDVLSDASDVAGEWSALWGGAGNDTINGSTASSMGLYGGDGFDTIHYGKGTAFIDGGAGADLIGPSANSFMDAASFGQVFNFEVGIDKVTMADIIGTTKANVSIQDWGPNTGLFLTDASGNTTTLMLMDVQSSQLDLARDFVFMS